MILNKLQLVVKRLFPGENNKEDAVVLVKQSVYFCAKALNRFRGVMEMQFSLKTKNDSTQYFGSILVLLDFMLAIA